MKMKEENIRFCREKINILKEKIRQISIEAGALAIRKVQFQFEFNNKS